MISSYILATSDLFESIDAGSKKLKEKAIKEYNESLLMPRKKKKKAKKSALLLYSIACHGDNLFN